MTQIYHQSPPVGQEISCVMKGIESSLLKNNSQLKKILLKALKECNFKILKLVSHNFTPHGFTIMALLSESHAAIHSYPEYSALYFSLYSCRGPKDAEKTFKIIKKKLNPKKIIFLKNDSVLLK
jgi:S-adenosylmethionine decarboxylase proenzyme